MTKTGLGFCGSHRVGKTTTAIALSESLQILFVPINTAEVFARFHLHPKESLGFRTRLEIQEAILQKACNIWDTCNESFVSDRTPIDMMAYTLGDVKGDTILCQETELRFEKYLNDCREATERYFSHLFLIPPAIPIVDAIGKASCSRGYIEHIHNLCLALFQRTDVATIAEIPIDCIDLGDRVKYVEGFYHA
jgi:hypothetical protein